MGSPRKALLPTLAAFAAVWLIAKFLLPLVSPFLLGSLLALAAEPMVRFLNRGAHLPRAGSTAIGVSMAFCFLATLLLVICAFALRQLKNLTGALPDLEVAARSGLTLMQTRLLELASHAPQGIRPLLELLESGQDMSGFSAADRVVGKAAAFLYCLLGVSSVYAKVISAPALQALQSHGIDTHYDTRVSAIRNRTGDGFCPMETAVWDLKDPKKAPDAIREALKKL